MDFDFEEPADCFGMSVYELGKKNLFLFDMDGTIYEENRVFEGTIELLNYINSIGGRYIFITNNSSKSVDDYVKKINQLGIKADRDNFFTSAQASILYIEQKYPYKKVYCQGTKSLVNELISSGIDVTENVEEVDVVLVGFDTELTSDKLRKTCEILSLYDVDFIATNPDLRCPVSFGYIPDCGSICSVITAATGKIPKYIGKPEPQMVDIVMNKLGYTKDETVVIGDRLYTDIAAGLNSGVTTVCVLTGEATVQDIKYGKIKPTFTFHSVMDIWKAIR